MNHTALHVLSNSIKLRDVMQGTTYISHSTFGWSVGETVRCSISKINRCSIPNIDRCLIPKIDQCAVAEVNDRLIAEWDRSQNRTAAPLLEHGIGPSLYCSCNQKTACRTMFGRATSRATVELAIALNTSTSFCSTLFAPPTRECIICQRRHVSYHTTDVIYYRCSGVLEAKKIPFVA